MTTSLLFWLLMMSAQAGTPNVNIGCPSGNCFHIATIDNLDEFCESAVSCFPILIDSSGIGGRIKGTPDKGKIACETANGRLRCINAYGSEVQLKFDEPPKAADETDGKLCKNDLNLPCCKDTSDYNSVIKPKKQAAEPTDVPAVQVGGHLGFEGCGQSACFDHWVTDYTCADKTRILLTAEDGTKHCVKFGAQVQEMQ